MSLADEVHRQAKAFGRAGQIDEAILLLHAEQATISTHAGALALLGTLLSMREQPQAAVVFFQRSLALDADRSVVHSDMGIALARLSRGDAALAAFNRALALDPANVAALNNRALHWLDLANGEAALADADAALALQPDLVVAHRQRGRALLLLERHAEAMESIERALEIDPLNAENYAARAEVLDASQRPDLALVAFDRAVALTKGEDANLVFKRGLSRLRQGDFERGWADYEHRCRDAQFIRTAWRHDRRFLTRQEFDLRTVAGQRVLVLGEQGLGDEIMFASMLPDLVALAAKVAWVSDARLQPLLQTSFPQVDVVADTSAPDLSVIDRIIPAGSLASLFRNAVEAFPGAPYLKPRAEVEARWRERLGPRTTPLRVGLSWRGGVFNTGGNRRSLDLAALAPFLDRPDCEVFSLQYGDVAAEIGAFNAGRRRPMRSFAREDINDFEQLAGLVRSLDVIVSVQTALVHLAGAVGAPCLAMIPVFPEWRYGQQGSTMPWYASVELFRQPRQGDWTSVLQAVGEALDRRGGVAPN